MPFDLDDALIKTSGASLLAFGVPYLVAPTVPNKIFLEAHSPSPLVLNRVAGNLATFLGTQTLISDKSDKKKRLIVHGAGWIAAGAFLLADSRKKEGRGARNDLLATGVFATNIAVGSLLLTRGLLKDK